MVRLRQRSASRVASIPEDTARRIALAGCTVLVTGETGTGKGHLARWIHAESARSRGAFVPVNCGALPEGVAESQLFGHVRGAFSGAERDHPGLVRAAEGGTLFLDEVGDLPLLAQTMLLRLLEEREVQPVGAPRPVSVDVRVLAATNRDLVSMVADGRFREDLYIRLDVIHLGLAPLRERPEELEGLVEQFDLELAEACDSSPIEFTDDAWDLLRSCDWPGNVRQVRTMIERLHVLLGGGPVDAAALRQHGQLDVPNRRRPAVVAAAPTGIRPPGHGDLRFDRASARLELAELALARHDGNVSRAAVDLGVHRSTLHRWLAAARRSA